MLNKLTAFAREYDLITPGDHIICALSGGADSMALLWSLYLLKQKLDIRLSAAHFNHHLRGTESDSDEAFVREFCHRFDIPLFVGQGNITPGQKGLEAAAREARYAFFATLDGKIATAHTADDNAETVLMHLVRGTGLKGLGGITPKRGNVIRPMLTVTRQDVLALLEAYCVSYRCDSSNDTDQFLRNRLRHHVMPLLAEENPRLAENLTAMALSLREDEEALEGLANANGEVAVSKLLQMPQALRRRYLKAFLEKLGVKEPERSHVALAESLVFSEKPSARACFPGGITLERCYDTLRATPTGEIPEAVKLAIPGQIQWCGWQVRCQMATEVINDPHTFTLAVRGDVYLRSRLAGDEMRLPGGTKSLKKLFIDRKIPASQRPLIPVLADEQGVLGVAGIGPSTDRTVNNLPAVQFIFEKI